MKTLSLRLMMCATILALLMTACSSAVKGTTPFLSSQSPAPIGTPIQALPTAAPGIVAPPLDGTWQGTIIVPGEQLEIIVKFTTKDAGIEAFLNVPEQGLGDQPMHDIQVDLPKVHFELLEGPNRVVMDGALRSDGKIAGDFAQSGVEGTFELVRQEAASAASPAPTTTPIEMVGGLVDVGGYELFYKCIGQGSPTVILEAGAGADSTSWSQVMSGVERTTRVCAYDRANLGSSDGAPKPRTYQNMTRDLQALLGKAQIGGPYILVGHSMGGMLVRVFADQYPGEVVGLVLVDAAHPDMGPRLLAGLPPETADEPENIQAWRQWFTWMSNSNETVPFQDSEGLDNQTCLKQVKAAKPLGDLPLVVISRSRDNSPLAAGWPPLPTETDAKLRQVWQDLQSDLVELSSNSTQVIAAQGGHMIPIENPNLVVDAIVKLVKEARNR